MIASKFKNIHNISGKLTLKETSYLLSKAKFIICGDTGPMHIAVAVNCPVIALFGGSNPQRTGPYQGTHTIIQHKLKCSPCYKKRCKNNMCLKEIKVKEVFEACEKIMLSN